MATNGAREEELLPDEEIRRRIMANPGNRARIREVAADPPPSEDDVMTPEELVQLLDEFR